MNFRPLLRTLAIVALLATSFALGFVAHLASQLEAPHASAARPFELAPLVALPVLHVLLNP
jgi:hypothetical protein